ncbi:MAG: hypothetical protein KDJ36_15295 [Hyphomicrobiaceae bacterium]|nr:hypothetical protein [Hyphomicrobiaceae bacterium]
MLLSETQIAAVRAQAGVDPVPADHTFRGQLAERYGDHTFYLGSGGLYILEPFGLPMPESDPAIFVNIAVWVDDSHSQLKTIPPVRVEHAVDLKAGA